MRKMKFNKEEPVTKFRNKRMRKRKINKKAVVVRRNNRKRGARRIWKGNNNKRSKVRLRKKFRSN